MTSPTQDSKWIKDNWAQLTGIIAFVFALGVIYAEFKYIEERQNQLEDRLNKKIKVIYQNVNEIDDLKAFHEWEKGYNKGLEDGKKKKDEN